MFTSLRRYFRRRKYRVGARLREFLAPDVLREVEIVDVTELDQGYVTARIRTWNALYVIRGLASEPELEPPRSVAIRALWTWTGQPWGGPIPDDDQSRTSSDETSGEPAATDLRARPRARSLS